MTQPALITSDASRFTPDASSADPLVFGAASSLERDQALRARQQQLLEKPITYVGNVTEFKAPDSWEKIVQAPEPMGASEMRTWRLAADIGPLRVALQNPLLTAEQEQYLFRKMNYLKFVANVVRETPFSDIIEPAKVTRIDALLSESVTIRNRLIEANVGLVLSIGSEYLVRDPSKCVSIAWPGLMSAVERFDYQRGTKFSTFAYRPIQWEFTGYLAQRSGKREAFQNSMQHKENFDPEDRSAPEAFEEDPNLGKRQMALIPESLSALTPRERYIVVRRFGLDGNSPETLQQIGEYFQVTKERIRQIEARALRKISEVLNMASG